MRVECDSAERGLWGDILAMANESRNRGVIQANETTPYPHSWIASKLCVELDFFDRTLQKFADQGRISENSTGITVINFLYYQEELYRKKRGRPLERPPDEKHKPEYKPFELDIDKVSAESRRKAAEVWDEVRGLLKTKLSAANYRTWVEKTIGLAYQNDGLIIAVPTVFVAEYLYLNQRSLIEKSIMQVVNEEATCEFMVSPEYCADEG